MKLKPIYIYLTIFVVFIISIVLFSNSTKKSNLIDNQQMNGQMPEDDVHKNLKSQGNGDAPSASNVMKEAIERMNKLKEEVNKNPNDTLKLREYADMLTLAHKPDEAIEYYSKILKFDPKRIDVLLQLTYVHFNKGDLDKALEYTNKALQVDKNNLIANYNLGAVLNAKGDKRQAILIWKNLAQKYPNTDVGHIAKESAKQLEGTNQK
ncbi:MAG: tetratricopeptide repeat protein [Stygiobacter sp.]|jgi:tetratricopeptide (TPR) repeat protein|uniref:Tetratricopeptide repeat protein n=1 Tax=Stygiobacter electus TaxID=3032292 RepID=A0AAE3P0P4_9BACT|nr:tetratricopeptide repeat protein [Stygiobacter electus]MDF1611542.1 tetratricopeptide repeat protein [Stygiobacter electus]